MIVTRNEIIEATRRDTIGASFYRWRGGAVYTCCIFLPECFAARSRFE
ncbi:hypothetical protein M527_22845 [Sphingobium indicum IP26]|nr:hypothetical protein M527_22845 [Sphingobium indicum IP26]EQB05232.1 hypothetical protein L286_08410 [Sphingobium sp. HDIP04]